MMPMLDTQSTDAVFALLRQVNRDHGTSSCSSRTTRRWRNGATA